MQIPQTKGYVMKPRNIKVEDITAMEVNLESKLLESPKIENNNHQKKLIKYNNHHGQKDINKTVIQRVIYKRPLNGNSATRKRIIIS